MKKLESPTPPPSELPPVPMFGTWYHGEPPDSHDLLYNLVVNKRGEMLVAKRSFRQGAGGGEVWEDGYGTAWPFSEVTHWMPLPARPNARDQTREPKTKI